MKTFFAGSFNPFTVGHASVVERALAMGFSQVVIGVGHNSAKPSNGRAEAIRQLYAGEPRVTVVEYSGLTADAASASGADCLLRAVRSVRDYEYERDLADANRALAGLETVLLPALPGQAWVSSSLVRELEALGRDTTALLPSQNSGK